MGIPDVVRVEKEYARDRGADAGYKGTFPCPKLNNESFFEGWKEGIISRRTEQIDEIFASMYRDWEKVNPPDPELKFVNRNPSESWCAGRENLRIEVIRALVSSYLDDLLE